MNWNTTTVADLKVDQKFATNELGADHWTVTAELPNGKFAATSTKGREVIVPDNATVFAGTEIQIIQD